MKKKQMVGAIAFLVGVVLVVFSMYERHRLEKAEGTLHEGESYFSGNQIAQSIGGIFENRLGSYRIPLMIALIGGIVLIIGGASVWITSLRKK